MCMSNKCFFETLAVSLLLVYCKCNKAFYGTIHPTRLLSNNGLFLSFDTEVTAIYCIQLQQITYTFVYLTWEISSVWVFGVSEEK